MNPIITEKTSQIHNILKENDVDLWLIFVRETSVCEDPVLPLVYGKSGLTWQSALIFTASNEKLAILGRFEAETARNTGIFDHVIAYDENIQPVLIKELNRLNPQQIAINTSVNDVLADGLSHGMYLNLKDLLEGTPHADRLVSAEKIVSALRCRKSKTEIKRIRKAIESTLKIYEQAFSFIQPGMTEVEIAERMHTEVIERGLDFAWPKSNNPAVNSGPDSPIGHNAPTEIVIEPGHLLHFDFGVKENDYCADIQRMVYILNSGEDQPPEAVIKGFSTIIHAIQAAFDMIKPGRCGIDVDAAARTFVMDAGYPEYKYATGHQLGRFAHDGGCLLGPPWPRYGNAPYLPIEVGQIYTLEPGLMVSGYGYVGIEEDILVTENGAEFLGLPQTKLITIKT